MAEQCLHSVKAFSLSHSAPTARRLRVARGWERTKPGQLTPADQRDIAHHMTSWSAVKLGRGCVFFAQRLAWHQSPAVSDYFSTY